MTLFGLRPDSVVLRHAIGALGLFIVLVAPFAANATNITVDANAMKARSTSLLRPRATTF